jgi:glycerol-3-phosphate cytidylyltransferase-like family protein
LPQSPSWLTRALNEIKDNLRLVGITVDTDVRKHRKRYIQLEKDGATVWIGCKYCDCVKYENGRDDKRIEHMKSVHSNICYIANCDEDLTSQESVEHIEGKHPGQHYN